MMTVDSAYLLGKVNFHEPEDLCVFSWLLSLAYFSAVNWLEFMHLPKHSYSWNFLCFPSVFISSVLSSLSWGRELVEEKTCNRICNAGRQTDLFWVLFFLMSDGYICLSYSRDSISNLKDNLDSFRGSVVCIPTSQSYLLFSRTIPQRHYQLYSICYFAFKSS